MPPFLAPTVNMKRLRPEGEAGPSLTLGRAPTARVRAIVWCESGGHQIEPDVAELIERDGEPVAADRLGGPADIRRKARLQLLPIPVAQRLTLGRGQSLDRLLTGKSRL
jgi:hypothetical protein